MHIRLNAVQPSGCRIAPRTTTKDWINSARMHVSQNELAWQSTAQTASGSHFTIELFPDSQVPCDPLRCRWRGTLLGGLCFGYWGSRKLLWWLEAKGRILGFVQLAFLGDANR